MIFHIYIIYIIYCYNTSVYQLYFSNIDPISTPLCFMTITILEEAAAIMPSKHSDTKIKPLPLTLANYHGRFITVYKPERALASVGEWPLHT